MELRQLLEILWRRRRLFAGILLGVFGGILALCLLVVPRYTATSKVLLYKSPSAATLLDTLGLRTASMPESVSDAEVANYLQIAQSNPVMQAVTQELELQRLRGRSILPRMIPGATWLLTRLGLENLLNATKPMQWDEIFDKSALQFFIPRPYVDISEDEDADVFTITAQSTDIAESVRLANAVVRAFINRDVEMQREEFYRFGDSIEARLPLAKVEYERTLKELQSFREENLSISMDDEVQQLVEQISTVASERDEASVTAERSRAMLAEAQRLIAATPRYAKSQEVLERNPVIDSVKLTLRDLYLEQANSRTLYTDKHPAMVDIRNRINQAREIIQEEAGKVYGSETVAQDPLYTELAQTAAQRASEVVGSEMQQQAYDLVLNKLHAQLLKFPARQTEYAILVLASRRSEQYYQTLMDINYQVETARSMAISNLRVVEAACIPPDITDYKEPDMVLHVALAVFLAGFFSLTGTFLREYLDPTVLRPDDAETAAGVPCLAALPAEAGLREGRIAPLPPGHAYRERISVLAAALESGQEEVASLHICLLPLDDEAASAIAAAHLGLMLAEERHTVLLLDLCLHRPRLDALLGQARAPGLAEMLAGTARAPACLQSLSMDGAALLAAGTVDTSRGAQPPALSRNAMEPVLLQTTDQFARAVSLAPALARTADGLRLAALTDGVLLLASQGVTTREALARAAREVTQAGGSLRGVLLLRDPAWKPFPNPRRKRG